MYYLDPANPFFAKAATARFDGGRSQPGHNQDDCGDDEREWLVALRLHFATAAEELLAVLLESAQGAATCSALAAEFGLQRSTMRKFLRGLLGRMQSILIARGAAPARTSDRPVSL